MMKYAVIVLSLMEAVWFVFDGSHALLTGSYVTATSGPRGGQLGPWASIITSAGIDPHSTAFKAALVIYGILWVVIIAAFARRARWAQGAMIGAAVCSLWYLPLGTVLSLVQIVLLVTWVRKQHFPLTGRRAG